MRTGVVLDRAGGALAKMLPPFRLGIGGPVAGGRQYMSWIHPDDLVGMCVAALEDERWSGPVNATAPEPVSNREFSRALGRALHRPALLPVPGAGAARCSTARWPRSSPSGARVVPAKPLVLGYEFAHPELGEALRLGARAQLAQAAARAQARRRSATRASARARSRRCAVLGLDDHAAGALAEQIGGGRPDPLLARAGRGSSTSR